MSGLAITGGTVEATLLVRPRIACFPCDSGANGSPSECVSADCLQSGASGAAREFVCVMFDLENIDEKTGSLRINTEASSERIIRNCCAAHSNRGRIRVFFIPRETSGADMLTAAIVVWLALNVAFVAL